MAYTEREVRALVEAIYRERFEDEVRSVGGLKGYARFRSAMKMCKREALALLEGAGDTNE